MNIDQWTSKIRGMNPEYNNLRQSMLKLANDEDYSQILYSRSYEEAVAYAEKNAPKDLEILAEIDARMLPFKVYHSRTDFFGLDQQLVEMLPFALWYGSRYRTVITISDGIMTATKDAIIPTLFCAEKAIYVGKTVNSARYRNIMEGYFKSRGANTVPEFRSLTDMGAESLYRTLEELISRYGVENVVINRVPNQEVDAALAIGRLMEKYKNRLCVVQYLSGRGIVSYSEDHNVGVGLDNKSYSFSEFVQLMGGSVVNKFTLLYDSSQYEKLSALFQTYYRRYLVPTRDEKGFNPWADLVKIVNPSVKDYLWESSHRLKERNERLIYQGRFSKKLFQSGKIRTALIHLQRYRIIQNCTEKEDRESVEIQFEYVDPELVELLRTFEEGCDQEMEYKSLKFIPLNQGLKVTNRQVKEILLYDPNAGEKEIAIRRRFIESLLKEGYILDLEIDEETGKATFVFKDEATMQLIRTQGTVFELIVYHYMRESGLFDDCETGMKISWGTEEELLEDLLAKKLQKEYSNRMGYKYYQRVRDELLYDRQRDVQAVMNEVDVIGISGMDGVMVSCKTSDKVANNWLYEINSVSDRFRSAGVMALASGTINSDSVNAFKKRANQMGVSVWGTETLWDPDKRRAAIRDVVKHLK